jgi:hypothetical protein
MPKFEYSQGVDLDDKHSELIVVDCLDPRFRSAFDEVAEEIAGGKKYDRAGTAGVSKSIAEGSDDGDTLRNIELGKRLHGIKEVHLFEHIQCGGYGGEENPEDHYRMLKLASGVIKGAIPNLTVKGYLFHEDHAELVDVF